MRQSQAKLYFAKRLGIFHVLSPDGASSMAFSRRMGRAKRPSAVVPRDAMTIANRNRDGTRPGRQTQDTSMTATPRFDTDAAKLREDIDALKDDMKALLLNLKTSAQTTGAATTARIGDEIGSIDARVQAQATASMAQIERQVGENPLLAVLIATGLGFVVGRLLSR